MDMLVKEEYYDLITSEHRLRSNFMNLIEKVATPLFDISYLLSQMENIFDINFAEGDQLDIIGSYVGATRYVDFELNGGGNKLDDEDYRILIKAKIAQNKWDGTYESLFKIWHDLFPDARLRFVDNRDMTCTILIKTDSISANQILLLFADKLIPRPCGVQYFYSFSSDPIFAFDIESDIFKGWDEGIWLDTNR